MGVGKRSKVGNKETEYHWNFDGSMGIFTVTSANVWTRVVSPAPRVFDNFFLQCYIVFVVEVFNIFG
jgi:hypothetical protein